MLTICPSFSSFFFHHLLSILLLILPYSILPSSPTSQTPQTFTRCYDKPWLTNSKVSTPTKCLDSHVLQIPSIEVQYKAHKDSNKIRWKIRAVASEWHLLSSWTTKLCPGLLLRWLTLYNLNSMLDIIGKIIFSNCQNVNLLSLN